MSCDHKFVQAGLRYTESRYPRAGSGAHDRVYGYSFFCEKCLESKVQYVGPIGNTYEHPLPDTTPATPEEARLILERS